MDLQKIATQDVKEVAPPGWGHTKAEKEKTKPWKPKSKIGGTAAAFKRALDDGRFKGLPGSKTKKEKTADMFKLMWSMKKKGDKPHYKPGTDKKYKKYQEDWKPEVEVVDTKARAKKAEKKRKEAESSLPPHLRLDAMKKAFAHTNEEKQITPMQDNNLFGNAYAGTQPPKKKKKLKEALSTKDGKKLNKAAVLSYSDDPKDQHRARVRQAEIDFKDLMRQRAKKKKSVKESFEIDTSAHKKAQKKAKMRNLAKGNTNPNEKAAAEKKAGGPKLIGEDRSAFKKIMSKVLKKKQEPKKAQKADDAGARAKRLLQRKVHAKYVSGSEDLVPDEMRD